MATENAKFFHLMSKELGRAGIKFKHVQPAKVSRYSNMKLSTIAIITTWTELQELPRQIVAFSFDDTRYPFSEEKIRQFFEMLRVWIDTGIKSCSSVLVGVDPGSKKMGLAFFLDDTFIDATTIPSNCKVMASVLQEKLSAYCMKGEDGEVEEERPNHGGNDAPKIMIKVGDGNYLELVRTLNCLKIFGDSFNVPFKIEMVNEFRSNSYFIIDESRFINFGMDARAAINIALREGVPIELYHHSTERRFPTRKQVRKVQHESRKLSKKENENIAINHSLATKVLLGKITMKDAIGLHKDQHKKTGTR
ncbi:hypothetical protein GF325_15835 [Candidatus Bathyarchaeota archaeon]|nr:hypothetical protein [Candidatus Bathyarchaeota archaeon]